MKLFGNLLLDQYKLDNMPPHPGAPSGAAGPAISSSSKLVFMALPAASIAMQDMMFAVVKSGGTAPGGSPQPATPDQMEEMTELLADIAGCYSGFGKLFEWCIENASSAGMSQSEQEEFVDNVRTAEEGADVVGAK
jgi:hypothetical protein